MDFNLCPPAIVYLAFSLLVLIILSVQNRLNTNTYCLGEYECSSGNNSLLLLIQILYILFFTFLLNILCRYISPFFSWILVITGILVFFISLGYFIIYKSYY